jgi:hypothetical protein
MPNTKQQPLQCTTELHRFVGCQFDSVSVDAIKRQIHDETGAAVALGNTAEGDAKAAEMFETRETTKFADSFTYGSTVQKPFRAKSAISSRMKSMWSWVEV